jgi:hypothetical protein
MSSHERAGRLARDAAEARLSVRQAAEGVKERAPVEAVMATVEAVRAFDAELMA